MMNACQVPGCVNHPEHLYNLCRDHTNVFMDLKFISEHRNNKEYTIVDFMEDSYGMVTRQQH